VATPVPFGLGLSYLTSRAARIRNRPFGPLPERLPPKTFAAAVPSPDVGRRRAYVLVTIGLLLLANGLYAESLVPEGVYRLEATPVADDDGARTAALETAGVLVRLDGDWGDVLRTASSEDGETAAYRASEAELPPGTDALLADGVRYAAVDGRLYLVTTTEDEDELTIRAARTTPARALESAATPVGALSGPTARTVREGRVDAVRLWTDRPDRLVRTENGYVLVTAEPRTRYVSLDLLTLLLYPAGYVVLVKGLAAHPSFPQPYTIAPAGRRRD
jgi:hypothetical protein